MKINKTLIISRWTVQPQKLVTLMLAWHFSNSTEYIPSWEADTSSASQEILRILWNQKFRHRVHKSPPTARSAQSYFLKLHSNIIHLLLGLPNGHFPSGFPTKTLCDLSSPPYPIRTTCPAHFTLLDLISRIVICEQHKSWSISLSSFSSLALSCPS